MGYTKKQITAKLPALRKLKYYEGLTFPVKKITDKTLVDGLYVLLNSKGLNKYNVVDEENSSTFRNDALIKSYARSYAQVVAREKFDIPRIYEMACKKAEETTNISGDQHLPNSLICTLFHTPSEDFKKVFPGIDSQDMHDNYTLHHSIISEAMEHVTKHRNIPGAKLAASFDKESLVGKYAVTENNVLSGFMKGSMTLKFVGFLPGKIAETRHGKRHGYDNFWDDHVPNRNYVVLDIINSTGAKEIEKWKQKKYPIDITPTLQVFDTEAEALSVAKQLNEFYKASLTLDY